MQVKSSQADPDIFTKFKLSVHGLIEILQKYFIKTLKWRFIVEVNIAELF